MQLGPLKSTRELCKGLSGVPVLSRISGLYERGDLAILLNSREEELGWRIA